ncbi:MAG: class I SAM-dependent methyltransferase [Bacilli bacterium]|nr:class I SAM-dependent methyltransferase [Bacilli bacterium]
MEECLICGSKTKMVEDKQLKLSYALCQRCGFIYKDKAVHLNLEAEHNQYLTHNNSFESEGYVKIFVDLIRDHIKPLNISGKILDFGSGPGPVLKTLLVQNGFDAFDYDPFFNRNEAYLSKKYQLITCTEVAEHFTNPISEFKLLTSMLEDKGYLLIMTKFRTMSLDEFMNWWYRRDRTHVSFYTPESLEEISKQCGLSIVYNNKINIMIFQK